MRLWNLFASIIEETTKSGKNKYQLRNFVYKNYINCQPKSKNASKYMNRLGCRKFYESELAFFHIRKERLKTQKAIKSKKHQEIILGAKTLNLYEELTRVDKNAYHTIFIYEKKAYHALSYIFIEKK